MKEILVNEINQLLQEITVTTDYLYQQKLTEGYNRLDGTIGHIMTVTDKLFAYKASQPVDFDENMLVSSLTAAMNAIEGKDSVMLADILSLEIADQFEGFISRI